MIYLITYLPTYLLTMFYNHWPQQKYDKYSRESMCNVCWGFVLMMTLPCPQEGIEHQNSTAHLSRKLKIHNSANKNEVING